jgi:hypothetical protein
MRAKLCGCVGGSLTPHPLQVRSEEAGDITYLRELCCACMNGSGGLSGAHCGSTAPAIGW